MEEGNLKWTNSVCPWDRRKLTLTAELKSGFELTLFTVEKRAKSEGVMFDDKVALSVELKNGQLEVW